MVFEFSSQLVYKKIGYHPTHTVLLPSGFEQSERYTRDLRSEDGEGRENVAEKRIRVLSIFMAITPSH